MGILCVLFVAAISLVWSEAKTKRWLFGSLLSLFFSWVIIDPIKAVFCGSALEPIATILFGGDLLSGGMKLGLLEDVLCLFHTLLTCAQASTQEPYKHDLVLLFSILLSASTHTHPRRVVFVCGLPRHKRRSRGN